MLSPQTQTNLKNAKTYFEEHLAVSDYLAEAERVVGQWIGKGAELLGLVGAVAQRDFVALCENNDLRTGTRLTQRLKTTRTVDGGTDHEHQAANRSILAETTCGNVERENERWMRRRTRCLLPLARALQACGYTIKNSARGDFRVRGISPELIVRFQSGIARLMTTPGSSWQSIPRRATVASTTFASTWRTDFALAR